MLKQITYTGYLVVLLLLQPAIAAENNHPEENTNTTAVLAAAGQFYISISNYQFYSSPLLTVSTDGGATWESKSESGFPQGGHLLSVSCTGSGTSAVCATVGMDSGNGSLLSVSRDGGNSWALKFVKGSIPVRDHFNVVNCTGSGSTALCVAAGKNYIISNEYPSLAVSNDGGMTWTMNSSITNPPVDGTYNAISCTGSGPTAICTAVGQYSGSMYVGHDFPILSVSRDGGNTWTDQSKSIQSFSENGSFTTVSCTGSGPSAVCAAAGKKYTTISELHPLLVVSTDGGNTWEEKVVTGSLPLKATFTSVSCTGSGSTVICAAGIEDPYNDDFSFPSLAVSTDGGNTWVAKSVTGFLGKGMINDISCTGNSSLSTVCVAAGPVDGRGPKVVVSKDGGNTWTLKSAKNPQDGTLYGYGSVNCTGNGSTAICVAGGDGSTLTVSMDGGNTWTVKPVTDFSGDSSYNGIGATS